MYRDYRLKYKDTIENNITLPYQLENYRNGQKAKQILKTAITLKKASNIITQSVKTIASKQ